MDLFSIIASPLAILFSTAVAILIARHTSKKNQNLAKLRATLDLMSDLHSDAIFAKNKEAFIETRDELGLMSLMECRTQRQIKNKSNVQGFLSKYEAIAIGVHKGILDEDMLKELMGSILADHYQDAKPLLIALQEANENRRIMENFMRMGARWSKDPKIKSAMRKNNG